jgi:hypothetical protein
MHQALIEDGLGGESPDGGELLSKVVPLEQQFSAVRMGQAALHLDYPQERAMLYYWDRAFNLAIQIMETRKPGEPKLRTWVQLNGWFGDVERKASALPDQLVNAAKKGYLDEGTIIAIYEKWCQLEESLDRRAVLGGDARSLPAWYATNMTESIKSNKLKERI